MFLISPDWAGSPWCQTEFLLAKEFGKAILGVLIESIPDELTNVLTAEWQLCDLVAGAERRSYEVEHPNVPPTKVCLSATGLAQLERTLQRKGIDPKYFPWPPEQDSERRPYRGLRPLEAKDAAIFFGREAEITAGLGALRTMREGSEKRMLVILGASGAGKSSFMRAGLWPRLRRDEWNFLTLPIVRPARAVISGPSGLAASLETTFRDLNQPKSWCGYFSRAK